MRSMKYQLGLAFVAVSWICSPLLAQDASPAADADPDQLTRLTEEIRQSVDAYVEAFNARNVDGLVALWTGDGVYTMRSSGERLRGREAITTFFQSVLADPETSPKLAVHTNSVEFVSPHVALERGNAVVSIGDQEPSESQYTAVYVKQQGKWLIDRVTEEEIVVEPSHYENLKPLEWMIGEWVDSGEGYSIELVCDWTVKQNYISRKYTVSNPEGVESSGIQIIGWDARQKQIRSWLFDSDGGFVSGVWMQRDDQWIVQSVATLPDGSSGSFTSVFRPLDDGNYSWQKVNRVLDGKLLPNLDEITVQRL